MPHDLEMGDEPVVDSHRGDNHTTATANPPLQEESNSGASSGLIFSVYSKAAKDEDNERAEQWQKDAKGIIIFAGLFSAAVAVLLAVTILDLRPNSQDISAFYLGNIYQVLADPNVTRSSTPPPVTQPPPFSPPRSAIWVNTLWFLSLVMSLSCALWATLLQQWARQYLHRVQPPLRSPGNRARMRAFFADGVDKMHIQWATEGLPMLLHLSVFLFFWGLAIFLFNVNREVFKYVIGWIGLFAMVYGLITLLPLIRQDSPYHSPLSAPAWFLYATMTYAPTVAILAFISRFCSCLHVRISPIRDVGNWVVDRLKDLEEHGHRRMLGDVEKAAEEKAIKGSRKIDVQILDWTISNLGDDDSLLGLFETIPRSFDSMMLQHLKSGIPLALRRKIFLVFCGFCERTLSSNSISDSEKARRLDIAVNAMEHLKSRIPLTLRRKIFLTMLGFCERTLSSNSTSDSEKTHRLEITVNAMKQIGMGEIHELALVLMDKDLNVPQTVEMGHVLVRCFDDHQDISADAQCNIAKILVGIRKRNDSWVTLAARAFGLPSRGLRDNIALRDESVLLAILNHVIRQHRPKNPFDKVLEALAEFDICNTDPTMQHVFCTLWNGIVQGARDKGYDASIAYTLGKIHHHYIALHPATHPDPTRYCYILWDPKSYLFCNIAGHRPDNPSGSSSRPPTHGANTASRQAELVENVIHSPLSSNSTITSEIGTTFPGPDITPLTNPVHPSSGLTSALPTAMVAAAQDITSTPTLSHPLEGSERQDSDIVATGAEPGTTASTHAPTPTIPPVPKSPPITPSESRNADVAFVSNSPPFALPSIGSSIPASHPTTNPTLPCLRPRGLVNTKNICFANAVLQLLVNSPPFWNLFRELGDLKEQREAGVPETGGGATPLMDATVRFPKEFLVEAESPSMQRQPLPDTGGTARADEEDNDDNVVGSFEPTYLYDAMKEKRQIKPLLDDQQQDAEEFLCLYLVALDEELLALIPPISDRQSASAALEVEEHEVSQSGQTEARSPGIEADFGSPITHIFGRKLRSLAHSPNQPKTVPTEDWLSVHLDIQYDSIRTVEDALAQILQPLPQSVQASASDLGNVSQQVLIEALPSVLVLHLNRVGYDSAAGGLTKIGKSIQFRPEIDIPLDILVRSAQRPSEPPHYKLYGALYHHGKSAGSGHYTVDLLRPNGASDTEEGWLHMDDEVATWMRHEDVFGEHGSSRAADAYVLFYCRDSPMGSS